MSDIETASSGDKPESQEKPSETTGADAESDAASNISVKHPLQNCWALWYFKNDRSRDWNENLKLVAKFQFVEDFWA